jgi:hypothetical protein
MTMTHSPSSAQSAEREAFEELMRSRGEDHLYRRDVPGCEKFGEYCRQNVQDQWEIWQARAAASARPIGEDAANVAIGEREAFLTWWCADVPEYMREKWKESVDECLRNNHAQDKLVGAWDGFQFGLTVARAALTAEKVAAEPVAWMTKSDGYVFYGYNKPDRVEEELIPLYTAPQPAQTQVALTDEKIIERCKVAGIKWIRPVPDDDENGGFPGMFDMATMDEMRALLGEAGGINADQA